MTRAAAVDLGTNTVRMLVAERAGNGFSQVYSGQVITRLGERLHVTGKLDPKAIKRTVDGVAGLLREAERFRPFELTIAATSAARDASNTAELDALLQKTAGVSLTVIPWEEEAHLALTGAALAVGKEDGRFILFDVGGGSTEYILAEEGRAAASYGTNLGVVRLAETYITKHPVEDAEYCRLVDEVETTVDMVFNNLPVRDVTLVGTAGTITSIAAMDMNMVEYDPVRINGYKLTADAVESLRNKICSMTLEERSRIPSLKNGREDLIVPGFAILLATMQAAGADHIIVSDYGLREGLVMKMLGGKTFSP
ncbi:MAG: Ppx/GppA family phosphatase [Nitrospinae bacterium]|nr:Ppx/GppA family phosphatase [Nitrospinota bacterium]